MVRFVYPNVNNLANSLEFLGCGRYLTTSEEDLSFSNGYEIASVEISARDQVRAAIRMLAPESFDLETTQQIYERKDQNVPYLGDSMGLAYLFTSIKRSRLTRFDQISDQCDIWCTGSIKITAKCPELHAVYPNLFAVKLDAFIENKDDILFIVPAGNLNPTNIQLLRNREIPLLSVKEFQKADISVLFNRQTVVKVELDELEEIVDSIFQNPGSDECPYLGLHAFSEKDTQFFFGRRKAIEKLVQKLERQPLVGVFGSSGSGKTSLIYAGLIPELQRRQELQHQNSWEILDFRPGQTPFKALARGLVCRSFNDSAPPLLDELQEINRLAEQLQEREVSLCDVLDQLTQKNDGVRPILVFVDQFEELYTYCRDEIIRRHFLEEILQMTDVPPSVDYRVVITMRADFLGKALAYQSFSKLFPHANMILGAMKPDEIEEVIKRPAAECGIKLDSGLTKRIVEEIQEEPGSLPLLEFALVKLWEKREGRTLTHGAYDEIGGVKNALASYAESVYEGFSAIEQEQTPKIFINLVHPGEGTEDTRRTAAKADIGEKNWGLVEELVKARLLVKDSRIPMEGESCPDDVLWEETVEVIHEALITKWQRLRNWIEKNRDFIRWQDRLRAAIRQWNASNRDQGALLRGAPLAEASTWLNQRKDDIEQNQQEFIQESQDIDDHDKKREKARQKKELRRLRIFAGSILMFALIISWLWIQTAQQRRLAERKTIEAFGVSAKALSLASDGLGAIIAAIKAGKLLKETNVPEDLQKLVKSNFYMILNETYEKNRLQNTEFSVSTIVFSPDKKWLISGDADGFITLWNANSGKRHNTFHAHDRNVKDLCISADASLLASGSFDKTVKLWDLHDLERGKAMKVLTGHDSYVTTVDFNRDGTLLASGGYDRKIILWDIDSENIHMTLEGHDDKVTQVVFSPDGTLLASSSDDHTIKLWDIKTGQKIRTFIGHNSYVSSVAFSPDGTLLASGSSDHTAKLWSIESGDVFKTFDHPEVVSRVAFSPDGKTLLSGSLDHSVRLWSVDSETPLLHTLWGHTDWVLAVSFYPDGHKFTSSGRDGTIRIWDIHEKPPLSDSLDQLLLSGCDWIRDYVQNNPFIEEGDRSVCDLIH